MVGMPDWKDAKSWDMVIKVVNSPVCYLLLFIGILIFTFQSQAQREKEYRQFMRDMVPIMSQMRDDQSAARCLAESSDRKIDILIERIHSHE